MEIAVTFELQIHDKVAFDGAMRTVLQQTDSRLMNTVSHETLEGEKKYFDGVSTIDFTEVTERAQASEYSSPTRIRRAISPRFFRHQDIFEPRDKYRLMRAVEPEGAYVQGIGYGYSRLIDSTIKGAFNGTAYGGRDGTTAYSFTSDNIIDSGDSSAGMTLAKLHLAREKMEDLEWPDEMMKTLVMGPRQFRQLLENTTITSSDYVEVKALVEGKINSLLGINFVRYNGLTLTGSSRECFLYTPDAMILGLGGSYEINWDVLPGKNHNYQLAVYADMAATRYDEGKIIQIDCHEA